MNSLQVMKQTLAYLENGHFTYETKIADDLRAAIQKEEQQPVPVKTYSGGKAWPVQAEWVGLTDDEILHIFDTYVGEPNEKHPLKQSDWLNFSQGIEAKLKEKNSKG
jgi:hypothetical protein